MKTAAFIIGFAVIIILVGVIGYFVISNPKVAVSGGGVFKSTDGGSTWKRKVTIEKNRNISRLNISDMEIDPGNSDRIYFSAISNGLYVSNNEGDSWTQVLSEEGPRKRTTIHDILIDRTDNNRMYLSSTDAGRGVLIKTSEDGQRFKRTYFEAGGNPVLTAKIHPKNAKIVYIGTQDGLLLKSDDQGETWERVFIFKKPVVSIIFDGNNPVRMIALVGKSLMRSSDSGVHWKQVEIKIGDSLDINKLDTIAVDESPKTPAIYIASREGIFKSYDFGSSWTELKTLFNPKSVRVSSIAVDPNDASKILIAAGSLIYVSVNNGKTWKVEKIDTNRRIVRIRIDPRDSNNIYLGVSK